MTEEYVDGHAHLHPTIPPEFWSPYDEVFEPCLKFARDYTKQMDNANIKQAIVVLPLQPLGLFDKDLYNHYPLPLGRHTDDEKYIQDKISEINSKIITNDRFIRYLYVDFAYETDLLKLMNDGHRDKIKDILDKIKNMGFDGLKFYADDSVREDIFGKKKEEILEMGIEKGYSKFQFHTPSGDTLKKFCTKSNDRSFPQLIDFICKEHGSKLYLAHGADLLIFMQDWKDKYPDICNDRKYKLHFSKTFNAPDLYKALTENSSNIYLGTSDTYFGDASHFEDSINVGLLQEALNEADNGGFKVVFESDYPEHRVLYDSGYTIGKIIQYFSEILDEKICRKVLRDNALDFIR